ncbi:hypothetical protein GUITHDRAFT_141902 [Guillardia theta CCMP2712]|uniref:Uncharacterized protein n=1 Tax=Guillardia theta (strain CCMP2712) TaxID=905079 RepID=L1IZI4_GUITC|nr:hypothetical protein GUITHDRAFT_141902 [Guillardia theta CCMP2712]EKX41661.1 hypothetical protein GUITHDRAFT_141902 [Guillardia theta CCMP2712]|eukprot:XP_005828641.1 hypothetical protein GUITHDRAFT_141902 [Guillardia theta CCMP2712]
MSRKGCEENKWAQRDQRFGAESKAMNEVLMSAIQEIARTGIVSYNWASLVHLLVFQLKNILEDSSEQFPVIPTPGLAGEATYQESCNRLYSILAQFHGPPFTVQRLCELLLSPHRHHKTKLKLLAAVDKLLSVTTIVSEHEV